MTIKALIVDDEPLARERIRSLLELEKDVVIAGECADAEEVFRAVKNESVDLLLLDIQMPGMDGITLARRLPGDGLPLIVFVTAYDAFAVKAFEVNAVDYLLKPFTRQRFRESIDRIRKKLRSGDKELFSSRMMNALESVSVKKEYPEKTVVKSGGKVRFVSVADILWIESEANYLRLHLERETVPFRDTVTNYYRSLDPSRFLRIHRSVIVNTARIKEMKQWAPEEYVVVLDTGVQLPIGQTFRKQVKAFFGL